MPAVQCDQCDTCFPVPVDYAGEKVICPRCKARVRVAPRVSHPALDSVQTGFHVVKWILILLTIGVGFLLVAHFALKWAWQSGL